MCAILGVSFAPGSKINRKKISAALLTEGQVRGRDASGYAWVGPNDTNGMFKKDVPGANLYVGGIPQDAEAIILHTRASTHGSPHDMSNNHPIESPGGFIRLVHNGVIWNHNEVRRLFDKKLADKLPQVDSSVIGAIIETYGMEETTQIEGDAAVAWFDTETGNTIHLARFQNSPVHFATLIDGTFVFASTASILYGALKRINQTWFGSYPTPFDSMEEGDYFQIVDGEVIKEDTVEWGDQYSSRAAYNSNWRQVTSGATTSGSTYDTRVGTPNTNPTNGAMSVKEGQAQFEAGVQKAIETGKAAEKEKEASNPTLALIKERQADIASAAKDSPVKDEKSKAHTGSDKDTTPMALAHSVAKEFMAAPSEDGTLFDPADDDPDYADNLGYDEDRAIRDGGRPIAPFRDSFFAVGHDGDYTTYTSLTALLAFLSWNAKVTGGENFLTDPDDGNVRYVNQIGDLGHLSVNGDTQLSWVTTPGAFEFYRPQVPGWVDEGIGKLKNLVGA